MCLSCIRHVLATGVVRVPQPRVDLLTAHPFLGVVDVPDHVGDEEKSICAAILGFVQVDFAIAAILGVSFVDHILTATLGLHVVRAASAADDQLVGHRPQMLALAAHVLVVIIICFLSYHIEHDRVLTADLLSDFVLGGIGC